MPWLWSLDPLDAAWLDLLPVARPAAAGVELGAGLEQRLAAADAVVAAVGPVVPVLAGEGALGGGVARHRGTASGRARRATRRRFCERVARIVDVVAHGISCIMTSRHLAACCAQSGGKPAYGLVLGLFVERPLQHARAAAAVSAKSPSCGAPDRLLGQVVAQHELGIHALHAQARARRRRCARRAALRIARGPGVEGGAVDEEVAHACRWRAPAAVENSARRRNVIV